jgi:hypothetical protein
LKICFYPAIYSQIFASVFPTVDICSLIPKEEADIAILEEPEHLNWFRVPLELDESAENAEMEMLGWAAKFRWVIGIIHTNYSAYLGQYSMGASLITAPALSALSSLVVRAYCHRVIRLSDSLPELHKEKEVTCNVHGVRSEFFQKPQQSVSDGAGLFSPIYFIGKLVWAKGFDKLLDIQDKYRDVVGEFFAMDVYGSGPDECAINRAFLGRKGLIVDEKDRDETTEVRAVSEKDEIASVLFSGTGSLKEHLTESINMRVESVATSSIDDLPNLFAVLGDAGGRTFDAGVKTTAASTRLGEKLFDIGFRATFIEEDGSGSPSTPSRSEESGMEREKVYHFSPAKTRFELRRQATPTRFLGVKDHAALRDVVAHKIFLNVSETEVLCTTTAEALAMGKFVIVPVHRKCLSREPVLKVLSYS